MENLKSNWWLMALKGSLLLIVGLIILFNPDVALLTIITYLGILALIIGATISLVAYVRRKQSTNWWFWFWEGIINIVLGILLVAFPRQSVSIVLAIIGIWALIAGLLRLFTLGKMSIIFNSRKMVISSSILMIIFGILILINPFKSALAISIVVGIFATIYGIISLITSYKMTIKYD